MWNLCCFGSAIAAILSSLVGASMALAIIPDDPGPAQVQFTINASQNVKAISPWIYGTNFGTVPNAMSNRIGGNRLTGYNWENNASNAGGDWYHHSDFGMATGPNDPPGYAFRSAIQNATDGEAVLVTVPMAGYVAADGNGTVDETEIAPSPRWKEVVPQKSTIYPGSSLSTSPNKSDGYVFTDELANWVEDYKAPNQPVFYSLDNEIGLWGETLPPGWQSGAEPRPWENPPVPAVPPTSGGRTHPTIHPFNPSFAELRDKTIAHAGAIKDVNPNAIVFGGVGYGWTDFTNLSDAPDAVTNPSHPAGDETGEMHYHEWLLQQVHDAEVAQGRKLMDVLDLHWYTEVYADGQRITGDVTTRAAVAARVQATRSLWDPTYVEDSWISQWGTWEGNPGNNGPIKLLPRVQRDIDDFNPGTKIAITEYNYGGNNHISGAIAQADALGIFGREGVFAANVWGGGTYINGAFDMYLNYDGAGGTFGSTSIEAETSSIAESAVYASIDESDPNRLLVVAINRTGEEITTGISVAHDQIFDLAEVYQLTGSSPNPQRVADIDIDLLNAFQYTMPAYSVTTLVLHATNLQGDFDDDGDVDGHDFLAWQRNPSVGDLVDWQNGYGDISQISATVSVPEPTTAGLVAGLLILFGMGRTNEQMRFTLIHSFRRHRES
ncbi:glycoside hydrolase family 44 protein [Bythopirellula goksoeyrii]|uniref:Beta-mannanase/endoglucanase A n=1 Tax=Bythopirellula goksoeyrii TaxID=1400387 RepID=A0A5B9QH33_9BACT|nr:glycoside hydrolase family 44 protein [Bythopirellula goksoeyrii]QEG37239.1 Beta-mannanase/endoglucanase A precursor [Bythopirellula goksoeyrii]